MIVKKIEVKLIIAGDGEENYFFLPSGYKGKMIKVFESAFEDPEVKLITKKEAEWMIKVAETQMQFRKENNG